MAIATKKFQFVADTENWTGNRFSGGGASGISIDTGDNAADSIVMLWLKRHKSHDASRTNPIIVAGGGCLRTTIKNGQEGTNVFWQWEGTWEGLGVPVGATVTSAEGDYMWRVQTDRKGRCETAWAAGAAQVGQFEIRKGTGAAMGIFSDAVNIPARSGFGDYKNYPNLTSEFPLIEKTRTWAQVNSQYAVAVPAAYQPSGSAIKLRLWVKLPDTEGIDFSGVRVKHDLVVIRTTYTANGKGYLGFFG